MKHRIEDLEIVADGDNYIVTRHYNIQTGKKKGEPAETAVGYYSNLGDAVKKMAEALANREPTLDEWLKKYKETTRSFERAVERAMEA